MFRAKIIRQIIAKIIKKIYIKMAQTQIVDIGHYEENNHDGGESKKVIRVLGESSEKKGMWLTADKDARGNNKLISEYDLLNNFTPMVTAIDEKGIKKLPSKLLMGIFDVEDDEIEEEIEEVVTNKITEPTPQNSALQLEKEIENKNNWLKEQNQNPQSNVTKSYDLPQQITHKIPDVAKPEDPNITFHKNVINKFKLVDDTQTLNIQTKLESTFDVVRLIGAIDLMSLDENIVLDILLEDKTFRKSLVGLLRTESIMKPFVEQSNVVESEVEYVTRAMPFLPIATPASDAEMESINITSKMFVEGKYGVSDFENKTVDTKPIAVYGSTTVANPDGEFTSKIESKHRERLTQKIDSDIMETLQPISVEEKIHNQVQHTVENVGHYDLNPTVSKESLEASMAKLSERINLFKNKNT